MAVAVVLGGLLIFAVPAGAQNGSQVSAGAEVAVANNGECRPNTEVALFFDGGAIADLQVGSALSDATGSFDTTVIIPTEATEGDASLLVDCGLDGAVLTYDLTVVASGLALGSLVGPALVGVAVIAIVGLVALLRRRRNASAPTDMAGVESSAIDLDIDAEGVDHQPIALGSAAGTFGIDDLGDLSDAAIATPPAATLPVSPGPDGPLAGTAPIELDPKTQEDLTEGPHAVTKGATDDAGDDGADYWFWEAATSLGPKRRIACMTDTTFHLHETTIEGFQPMLDRLVEVGPDVALAQAFVRLPIALVERAVREGTTLHLEGRGPDGRRRRSIELGDGVDGVAEMLARRVPVVLARASEDAGR